MWPPAQWASWPGCVEHGQLITLQVSPPHATSIVPSISPQPTCGSKGRYYRQHRYCHPQGAVAWVVGVGGEGRGVCHPPRACPSWNDNVPETGPISGSIQSPLYSLLRQCRVSPECRLKTVCEMLTASQPHIRAILKVSFTYSRAKRDFMHPEVGSFLA